MNDVAKPKGRIKSFWSEATGLVKAVTGLLLAIPPVVAAVLGILYFVETGELPGQSESTTEASEPDPERPPEGEVFHRERDHWDQERD